MSTTHASPAPAPPVPTLSRGRKVAGAALYTLAGLYLLGTFEPLGAMGIAAAAYWVRPVGDVAYPAALAPGDPRLAGGSLDYRGGPHGGHVRT